MFNDTQVWYEIVGITGAISGIQYIKDIKKMIAIIQSIDGKKVWNINCILSGMEVLKAHVDDDSQTILKMEKASLMDYVKKIPAAELKKMAGMKMPAGAVGEDGEGRILREDAEERGLGSAA